MLSALEPVVADAAPDCVLVYGDTNSTLAGALAAVQQGVPVAHVEAGMRSYDRAMPEEVNRVLTDHLSTLLLCSSEVGVANLAAREGMAAAARRSEVVGDVMVDVALEAQPRARERVDLVRAHGLSRAAYVLATAHRAGNVDDPARLLSARRAAAAASVSRWCCRCTRGPARGWRRRGCSSGSRAAARCA